MEIVSACFDTKFFQTKVFDHAKWTIKLIDRIFLIDRLISISESRKHRIDLQ